MSLQRRTVLIATAAATLPWHAPARATESYPQRAFDARTLADALAALGATGWQQSREVTLQAPDLAEDGAQVPLSVATSLPGVKRIALLIERNPHPLMAVLAPTDAIEPTFALRAKLQESSKVLALAQLADGRVLGATREVRVTAGGCAADTGPEPVRQPAAVPIKLRAQSGRPAVARALITHEMESGQRKDAQGRVIPAWHITEVQARLNGQPALGAWWGASVARNPLLQITLKSAKAGDRLALAWVDNRGERRSDEAAVT